MTDTTLAALITRQRHPLPPDLRAISLPGGTAILDRVAPVSNRKDALRLAESRHRLYETLLALGDVIPFAPGPPLRTEELPGVMAAHAATLALLRDRVAGQQEYRLEVVWDEARVLSRFRASPELSPLFSGRKTAPQAIADAVGRLASRLEGDIRAVLAPSVTDTVDLPRGAGTLAHLALLCPVGGNLDAALAAIDSIWTEGLTLRLIGPTAAESFALAELERVSPAEIAAAAGILGLVPGSGQEEISRACKARLRTSPAAAAHLRRAAEVLSAFSLRSGPSVDGPGVLLLRQVAPSVARGVLGAVA